MPNGAALFVHPGLYNVAVCIQGGRILGVIPKGYLPNYREFYEQRQFREGREVRPGTDIELLGRRVPFGMDVLFEATNQEGLIVGAEICGHTFANGAFYVLRGQEQPNEDWRIARLNPQEETPAVEDIAVVPFACRSLTFDGELFWSNYRAKETIISFALPN